MGNIVDNVTKRFGPPMVNPAKHKKAKQAAGAMKAAHDDPLAEAADDGNLQEPGKQEPLEPDDSDVPRPI